VPVCQLLNDKDAPMGPRFDLQVLLFSGSAIRSSTSQPQKDLKPQPDMCLSLPPSPVLRRSNPALHSTGGGRPSHAALPMTGLWLRGPRGT
jgi:hypothetical protein